MSVEHSHFHNASPHMESYLGSMEKAEQGLKCELSDENTR